MSKFKDGARVEYVGCGVGAGDYDFVGASGTIKKKGFSGSKVLFDSKVRDGDKIKRLWFCPYNELKLITEKPMEPTHEQKLQALKDSVKHWEEIVSVFGSAKVSDEKQSPDMNASDCALCGLHNFMMCPDDEACHDCSLGEGEQLNCTKKGSFYQKTCDATTNPEAYEASKAMLARLQELLKEEEGRKPEYGIRVGDFIYSGSSGNSDISCRSGVVVGTPHPPNTRGQTWYQTHDGLIYNGETKSMTLIHRPTTSDKK